MHAAVCSEFVPLWSAALDDGPQFVHSPDKGNVNCFQVRFFVLGGGFLVTKST